MFLFLHSDLQLYCVVYARDNQNYLRKHRSDFDYFDIQIASYRYSIEIMFI